MNKFPLDSQGIVEVANTILEHNKAQEDLILVLSTMLLDTTPYVTESNPTLAKKAEELLKSLSKRKSDFENLRFDQKNGHKSDKISPYEMLVPNTNMPLEQEVLLSQSEESFGEVWTEEQLARHFNEPLPKKKEVVDVSKLSLEEINEWEAKQANSNDIYKVSARIKNLARQGGLASLTPVGESLCNVYTHVLKAFYDFAEGLSDKDVKIKLVELTRSQEGMPGNFISAMHANVDTKR